MGNISTDGHRSSPQMDTDSFHRWTQIKAAGVDPRHDFDRRGTIDSPVLLHRVRKIFEKRGKVKNARTVLFVEKQVFKVFPFGMQINCFKGFFSFSFQHFQIGNAVFFFQETIVRGGLGKQKHDIIKVAPFFTIKHGGNFHGT